MAGKATRVTFTTSDGKYQGSVKDSVFTGTRKQRNFFYGLGLASGRKTKEWNEIRVTFGIYAEESDRSQACFEALRAAERRAKVRTGVRYLSDCDDED